MEIPYTELDPKILRAMIEEFVLREGTDYGHTDYNLEDKIQAVQKQLEKGKVKIIYSEEDETFDIVRAG